MPSSQSSLVYSRTQNRLVHFSSLTAQKATLPTRPPRRRPPLGARGDRESCPPRTPPPCPAGGLPCPAGAPRVPAPVGGEVPKAPQTDRGPPQPLIIHQRLIRQLARETPLLRRLPRLPQSPRPGPGVTPPQRHCDVSDGWTETMWSSYWTQHGRRRMLHLCLCMYPGAVSTGSRHSLSPRPSPGPGTRLASHRRSARGPLDGPPAPPCAVSSFRFNRKNKHNKLLARITCRVR